MSSTFGRSADFEDHVTRLNDGSENYPMNSSQGDATAFHPETAGDPLVEPIFGTRYWSHEIPTELISGWMEARQPQLPPDETNVSLPPINPFVPKNFDLKELPSDDSHHPLLFCSLMICVSVGKKKVSFVQSFHGAIVLYCIVLIG